MTVYEDLTFNEKLQVYFFLLDMGLVTIILLIVMVRVIEAI